MREFQKCSLGTVKSQSHDSVPGWRFCEEPKSRLRFRQPGECGGECLGACQYSKSPASRGCAVGRCL